MTKGYLQKTDSKIKVGFISKNKPTDKKVWSGTMYQLYKNIESIDNVEVLWIPAEKTFFRKFILYPFTLSAKISRKNYSRYFTFVSKFFCKEINKSLVDQVDVLFVPSQALYCAYLETNKPMIYLTDATFKQIYNYYDDFTNFTKKNISQSELIHQKTYKKAWRIIAASDWTKKSLMTDYSIDSDKIRVIEFGANLDYLVHKDIDTVFRKEDSDCLNVLFLGVDWNRKGGDIAVDAVDLLNKKGIKTVLNVVGLTVPNQYKDKEFIKEFGFLDKGKDEDLNLLRNIISKSHLLILPSKAECAGIVFCEASAYGIPIFTCDTGGVANYVINGENGYRLSVTATGKEFADRIEDVINKGELLLMRKKCIDIYNARLNWNRWNEKFMEILEELNER